MLPNDHLVNILMYGSNVFNWISNESNIIETIQFIRKSDVLKNLKLSAEQFSALPEDASQPYVVFFFCLIYLKNKNKFIYQN